MSTRQAYDEKVRIERIAELLMSIRKYAEQGKPVPVEWVNELQERVYTTTPGEKE